MNLLDTGRRLLGLDHGGDRYQYVDDPVRGPVHESRRADRWVRTTCGYCSVGCGMLLGVAGERVVAVAGDPEHPVNRGRLCPKGLSEHHTITAPGRLTTPTIAGEPATWDAALDRVVGDFRRFLGTFTAGPAIRSWFALAEAAGAADALRAKLASGAVVVGCVGPVCAEVAEEEGIGHGDLVVPRTSRLGPLVRAVGERLLARARHVGDLVITGTVVHAAGRRVELSDTEARILASLAGRPGAVVSKADLLREVWADEGADPHLVEVAVGRLRRRLGAQGSAIAAVPRRGYVLR